MYYILHTPVDISTPLTVDHLGGDATSAKVGGSLLPLLQSWPRARHGTGPWWVGEAWVYLNRPALLSGRGFQSV